MAPLRALAWLLLATAFAEGTARTQDSDVCVTDAEVTRLSEHTGYDKSSSLLQGTARKDSVQLVTNIVKKADALQTRLKSGTHIALEDVQRIQHPDGRCLNFLHIPKAAGTSIEHASVHIKDAGEQTNSGVLGWGLHDNILQCSDGRVNEVGTYCTIHGTNSSAGLGGAYIWHTPPSWDSLLKKSYKECTTFCVVRDPIKKIVSEWTYFGGCNRSKISSVKEWTNDFDEWAATSIKRAQQNPFHGACHWLPQTEYIYGHTVTADGQQSVKGEYCQRVLRFENLRSEFDALMLEFQLPISLGHHNPSTHCNTMVSENTSTLIKQFYNVDYKTLGY